MTLRRHPSMDVVIAVLPVVVGCVMVYFSAISLYTWP